MTDRETKSMEQCAREHRDYMEAQIERIERVREMAERAGNRFGLDEELERLEQELQDAPYGIGVTITINVELYGGGPAGGVEFECERERYGLSWTRAHLWHQDWFQPKGYVKLDDDMADRLWAAWGLESYEVCD